MLTRSVIIVYNMLLAQLNAYQLFHPAFQPFQCQELDFVIQYACAV